MSPFISEIKRRAGIALTENSGNVIELPEKTKMDILVKFFDQYIEKFKEHGISVDIHPKYSAIKLGGDGISISIFLELKSDGNGNAIWEFDFSTLRDHGILKELAKLINEDFPKFIANENKGIARYLGVNVTGVRLAMSSI